MWLPSLPGTPQYCPTVGRAVIQGMQPPTASQMRKSVPSLHRAGCCRVAPSLLKEAPDNGACFRNREEVTDNDALQEVSKSDSQKENMKELCFKQKSLPRVSVSGCAMVPAPPQPPSTPIIPGAPEGPSPTPHNSALTPAHTAPETEFQHSVPKELGLLGWHRSHSAAPGRSTRHIPSHNTALRCNYSCNIVIYVA